MNAKLPLSLLVAAIFISTVTLSGIAVASQQLTPFPAQLQIPSTATLLQQSSPHPKQSSPPGKAPITRPSPAPSPPQQTSVPNDAAAPPESGSRLQQTSQSNEVRNAVATKRSDTITAALIGLIGAVVGALIALGTSLWVAARTHKLARLHERESYEHRKKAFREMLEVEIKQNLEMLDWDHESIKACPDNVGLPEWMAGIACPSWSTTVWDSGLTLWPDILSNQQRVDLQSFYVQLRSLSSTRTFLTTLVSQAQDSGKYSAQRTALVQQAQTIANGVLRRGNPLQSAQADQIPP